VESVKPAAAASGDADVRLDLRGREVRSFDAATTLFDNKLSDLKGIQLLKRLKVLDITFNEFTGAGSLDHCPMLQQLYLASTQITSLTSLPQLPRTRSSPWPWQEEQEDHNPDCRSLLPAKTRSPHSRASHTCHLYNTCALKRIPYSCSNVAFTCMRKPPCLWVELSSSSNDRDLSVHEKELAGQYPPHVAWCLQRGWKLRALKQAVA
jgi:hypothetical protein